MTDWKLPQADWDDTLNAYLEGRALRADAEDLLMRINLGPAERDQIERSLRLSDELTKALRGIELPVGGGERMVGRLRKVAPMSMPRHWTTTAAGDVVRAADAPPLPASEDDWVDAAVEGRVSLAELMAMRSAGRLSEEGAEALDVLEAAEATVTAASPAAARIAPTTTRRLVQNLRAHMGSGAGELDAKVVDRLLGKSRGGSVEYMTPDVMAAEERPEEED